MVQKRHPEVATHIVEMLSNHPNTPCLEAAVQAAEGLDALPGFTPPSWHEWGPGHLRGNQRRTSQEPPAQGGNTRLPHIRSVSKTGSSRPCPTPNEPWSGLKVALELEFPLQCVRQVSRRGLTHPCSALFSCGVFVSHSPHPNASAGVAVHSTLVATTGQLALGLAVESAAARVCREGGARVTTNVMVRDMDVVANPGDARRLEIVADGLPMFGRVQLAIDTTLVSALRCDGSALPRCANVDGAAGVGRPTRESSPGRAGWGGGRPLVRGDQRLSQSVGTGQGAPRTSGLEKSGSTSFWKKSKKQEKTKSKNETKIPPKWKNPKMKKQKKRRGGWVWCGEGGPN